MVLCNGHVPTGGLMHDGNPILDFHAFRYASRRLRKNHKKPSCKSALPTASMAAAKAAKHLAVGHANICPTSWNWIITGEAVILEKPTHKVAISSGSGVMTKSLGLVFSRKSIAPTWLQYAWDWVRNTDTNGYLEMPGGRTASSAEMRWYFANNPSDACPTGRGDEAAIRAVWANDSSKLNK